MADADPAPIRILAVAESDAYLKWAAWTLDRLGPAWRSELAVLRSPIAPSDRQVADALTGTSHEPADVTRTTLSRLRQRLHRDPPDILLLACTGPSILAVGAVSLPKRGRRRPVVVSGLPGVALPIHRRAIHARRDTDVFVAHSRLERDDYRDAFAAEGLPVRVALATLPFLAPTPAPIASAAGPVVFAAQPSVPPEREERLDVLRRLAALAPPAAVVKLRTEDAEAATHNEPWPYPDLWRELVTQGQVRGDELEFLTGPLEPVLATATCLVTVSSTAALEAIARDVPVLLVDQFGVDDRLLNGMFTGSGLFGPLDDKGVDAAGAPDAAWREDNYFHPPGDNDLVLHLTEAGRGDVNVAPRPRRAASTAWTAVRRTIRLLTTPGRDARTGDSSSPSVVPP